MAQTLPFAMQGGAYAATYTSTGDTVVQLTRTEGGWLNIYANIEGMERKAIASWTRYEGGYSMIFKVCLPPGIIVTIESESEVTQAKTQTEE